MGNIRQVGRSAAKGDKTLHTYSTKFVHCKSIWFQLIRMVNKEEMKKLLTNIGVKLKIMIITKMTIISTVRALLAEAAHNHSSLSSLYSMLSTSAFHVASMMFSETPIVPQCRL